MAISVKVGDEIEVYGVHFTLMALNLKANHPPQVVFKSRIELMEKGDTDGEER